MSKILLVGSDFSLRDMFVQVLEINGFDSVVEESAKDGLDRISDEFFPACVVFLAREEALWFIIKTRALHSVKASSVPILAVADENSENISEYIERGATKAISKFPASGDRLVTELRKILNVPWMGMQPNIIRP